MSCEAMMTTPPAKHTTAHTIDDIKLIRRRCLRNARKRFHVSGESNSGTPDDGMPAPGAAVEFWRARKCDLCVTMRV